MSTHPLPPKHSASVPALASALALVTFLGTPATAQETSSELGRLFFTPERRQVLDRQRQLHIQEKQDVSEDPSLTINGVVSRSSGKQTVWINGRSQNDNESATDVSITPIRKDPGKLVVKINELPATRAKVGDTVNRNSGEPIDLLNGGTITSTTARKASGR